MHPESLGIYNCELNKFLGVVDKETQTSHPSIIKDSTTSIRLPLPRLPLPKDIDKSDKGSVTIFGFAQIIQDPESPKSITIVRESLTEEIHNHSGSSSLEDTTSNRYRYCKEVIKPYLKSYHPDCPDSEERLVRDALDSANEEFPDYQPCFEIYEGAKDKKEKKASSDDSSVSKIDAVTSYNSNLSKKQKMESDKSKECLPKKDDGSSTLKNQRPGCSSNGSSTSIQDPACPKKIKPGCAKVDNTPPSPPKPRCPPKQNPSCSNLPKPGCPPPADSCKEAMPEVKSTKNKTCSSEQYFGIIRQESSNTFGAQTEKKEKTMIDAHNETMTTIKTAMEDFICKVYKTTQDAVTLIKTESAKQFENLKKSASSNTDTCSVPKKTSENKSAETGTSFNFMRKITSQPKTDSTTSIEDGINAAEILGKLAAKVDSTISVLSEHINIEKLSDILKPSKFNDTSSPYDVPTPPPRGVSHIVTQDTMPVSNSVFAAIKTKICSIFCDAENNAKEVASKTSSSSSSSRSRKESDEDLLNRLIE